MKDIGMSGGHRFPDNIGTFLFERNIVFRFGVKRNILDKNNCFEESLSRPFPEESILIIQRENYWLCTVQFGRIERAERSEILVI